MQLSMFSQEEHPASLSPRPEIAGDWLTLVATSPSPSLPSLIGIVPVGFFGKMCPEFCHRTEDKRLLPSSGRWGNAGMGGPTGCLTLSMPESLSGAAASSLSDILDRGPVPQRYFLTARACAGILRRVEARKRKLPPQLHHALAAVAGTETTPTPQPVSSPTA